MYLCGPCFKSLLHSGLEPWTPGTEVWSSSKIWILALLYYCIFLSERQHYVTFHPLWIFRYHWSLMFTFLFTFLFTWKMAGDLNWNSGALKKTDLYNHSNMCQRDSNTSWPVKCHVKTECVSFILLLLLSSIKNSTEQNCNQCTYYGNRGCGVFKRGVKN